MIVTSDAIVLKSQKQGDSSKILSLFTREKGLVKVLAKGARTQKKSQFSTELLSINSIAYYQKRSGDLHTLSRSERHISTSNILTSYVHTNIAIMIMESLLQSLHTEAHHEELYDKTVLILQKLNDLPTNPFTLFILHQLILAYELGFEIDLYNMPEEDCFYHIESGNWYDYLDKMSVVSVKFKQIDAQLLKALLIIMQSDNYNMDIEGELPSSQKIRFIEFFSRYFSFHLEKKFAYTVY